MIVHLLFKQKTFLLSLIYYNEKVNVTQRPIPNYDKFVTQQIQQYRSPLLHTIRNNVYYCNNNYIIVS